MPGKCFKNFILKEACIGSLFKYFFKQVNNNRLSAVFYISQFCYQFSFAVKIILLGKVQPCNGCCNFSNTLFTIINTTDRLLCFFLCGAVFTKQVGKKFIHPAAINITAQFFFFGPHAAKKRIYKIAFCCQCIAHGNQPECIIIFKHYHAVDST